MIKYIRLSNIQISSYKLKKNTDIKKICLHYIIKIKVKLNR